jgi:Mg-chelatase subunit ChlD
MNDDFPFTTIGDEAVEARIVAWVLGEASAFEAAELERLCEERPELLVFRRRMLALHGLLIEAETQQPNEAWKLPPEKRSLLEASLGALPVATATVLDPRKEFRIRRSGRRAMLAIAACVLFAMVLLQLIHPVWIRQMKRLPEKTVDFMPAASTQKSSDQSLRALPGDARNQEEMLKERRSVLATMPKPPTDAERDLASDESELRTMTEKLLVGESAGMKAETSAPGSGSAYPGASTPAAAASGRVTNGTVPLVTDLPAARIEGTPKPIVLPNMPAEPLAEGAVVVGEPTTTVDSGTRVELRRKSPPMPDASKRKARVFASGATKPDLTDFAEADREAAKPSAKSSSKMSGGMNPKVAGGMGSHDGFAVGGGAGDAAASAPAKPDAWGSRSDGTIERQDSSSNKQLEAGAAKNSKLGTKHGGEGERPVIAEVPVLGYLFDDANTGKKDELKKTAAQDGQRARSGGGDVDAKLHFEKSNQRADAPAASVASEPVRPRVTVVREFTYPTEYSPPELPKSKDATRDELLARAADGWDDKRSEKELGKYINGPAAEGLASVASESEAQPMEMKKAALQDAPADDAALRKADKSKNDLAEKADAPLEPSKPKVDLSALMEEMAAAQDPYSTFSLNISDASFQIAQAAMSKGERPDPAGIKVEQFYNAVDYGDPSPAAGEPVAMALEQAAHPVIPGRTLVRVALKTAAEGRAATQALRLTLLVDQSGSMVRDDRRAAMDKALASLAGLLTPNDRITVIGFSRKPRLLADGWTSEQAAKLSELVNQTASEGGTNLEEAIQLGEQLAVRHQLAGAQNRIVLFTDGAANLGTADPARLAARVKVLRQKGIAFDIAGIAADELNDGLLAELARNGNGRYYVVGKGADDTLARQLAGAFRPAAENVKVQVRFNPQRVGRYKLIGFEKDRLKTEDFRNDTVDAAELAAEEAGVAIYQVEPLPGGSGELGEVSVRFRNAASGQMVERTWTIPHNANAPAIDRSTPSMQLAVLAMFTAEKLRGGPLGDAIDFKRLAEPRANVKRIYGNSARVVEVLHMIDSL